LTPCLAFAHPQEVDRANGQAQARRPAGQSLHQRRFRLPRVAAPGRNRRRRGRPGCRHRGRGSRRGGGGGGERCLPLEDFDAGPLLEAARGERGFVADRQVRGASNATHEQRL
jgi:hypothetical protein